jgi:copper chaperone
LHRSLSIIIKPNQRNIMAEITLLIDGMHCGSCIRRVTQALTSIPDARVQEVRLGAARVNLPAEGAPVENAIAALAKAGYNARLER